MTILEEKFRQRGIPMVCKYSGQRLAPLGVVGANGWMYTEESFAKMPDVVPITKNPLSDVAGKIYDGGVNVDDILGFVRNLRIEDGFVVGDVELYDNPAGQRLDSGNYVLLAAGCGDIGGDEKTLKGFSYTRFAVEPRETSAFPLMGISVRATERTTDAFSRVRMTQPMELFTKESEVPTYGGPSALRGVWKIWKTLQIALRRIW